jgi:hypothetical protein
MMMMMMMMIWILPCSPIRGVFGTDARDGFAWAAFE